MRDLLVGRHPGVTFKARAGLLGDLTGIPLTRGVYMLSAPALRCDGCEAVIIPGRPKDTSRAAAVLARITYRILPRPR